MWHSHNVTPTIFTPMMDRQPSILPVCFPWYPLAHSRLVRLTFSLGAILHNGFGPSPLPSAPLQWPLQVPADTRLSREGMTRKGASETIAAAAVAAAAPTSTITSTSVSSYTTSRSACSRLSRRFLHASTRSSSSTARERNASKTIACPLIATSVSCLMGALRIIPIAGLTAPRHPPLPPPPL